MLQNPNTSRYEFGLPGNSLLYADLDVACLAAVLDPDGVLVFCLVEVTVSKYSFHLSFHFSFAQFRMMLPRESCVWLP